MAEREAFVEELMLLPPVDLLLPSPLKLPLRHRLRMWLACLVR